MKLLRNPIVVGLLAVVAFALVAKSLWPVFSRGRGSRRAAAPSAPARPTAAQPAPATRPATVADAKKAANEKRPATQTRPAPAAPVPTVEADWARVQTNGAHWVESPQRDPFQVRDWTGRLLGTNRPASDFLTLTGIWRQTGGALAVINGTVVGEGDSVLEFKIQSIESDRVWVYGPSGAEPLAFKSSMAEEAETPPGPNAKKPPTATPGPAPPPR